MVIPGFRIVKYIRNIMFDEQVQPAGIDLTVSKVFKFKSKGYLGVRKRDLSEVYEVPKRNGKWFLAKGVYKVLINEIIHVPEDAVGICFPRSSLLRMGVDVRCALWDPGYYGRSEILLVVHNDEGVVIEENSRIAQIVFIRLTEKPHKLYSGRFRGENI
ncbi:MAG: deoxyuridine 5'-triphosphate nucleotidohydrolase [Thermoprotei archaeon]|nr:MAG: deoxyuridine 5'-triphosphate nucleotidohydrolase [Thermoprotei archaeon]